MSLFTKIFGTASQRELKSIYPIADKVDALEEEYKALTDAQLQAKTPEFKARLANGETLDDILPEAFAACREAAWRVLGMKPYRVQLIGGIILHQGRIAEMKTGEGKTLVATLPAYLNALAGEGVHIVTVNDYLAKRDSEWMGKVYRFLGLTVGLVIHDVDPKQRKAAYDADITYGTNNEFGFDYLRDNMAIYASEMVQRGHAFAIVDEVDSILIDEARTPLIISGQGDKSTQLYTIVDSFVARLKGQRVTSVDTKEEEDPDIDADYIVDEKARTVTLTARGIAKAEQQFQIENLSDPENTTLSHHINQAIRARGLMKRDIDYVVKDGEVIIVDEFTGRLMYGRRYSEGLHQAIEAKEHVEVARESKTLATITFQNYFRLYGKLSGMTGTAMTEEEEFGTIYALDIVEIPTNRPLARKDNPDVVYKNEAGKYRAIVNQIVECHEKGQPVLVGTISIEKSEELSGMLKRKGIKHNVLNAKFHASEADIVAQAGYPSAVTIATNMAGRGTDIMLGGSWQAEVAQLEDPTPEQIAQIKADWQVRHDAVLAAGGLHIIGTERHESRRIDNQLRGRSGRQGDAGSSRFYLSMEDALMRIFASDRVSGMMRKLGMKPGEAIEHPWVTKAIANAQRKVESRNFDIRKQLLEYDDVANDQRRAIYTQRNELLDVTDVSETINSIREDVFKATIDAHIPPQSLEEMWDIEGLQERLKNDFDLELPLKEWLDKEPELHEETLRERILQSAIETYQRKEEVVGAEMMRHFEKGVMLQTLDSLWKEHLAAMDYLRQGIHLRGYAQKDPKQEYKRESFSMFASMLESLKYEVISTLSKVQVRMPEEVEAMEQQRREEAERLAQMQQLSHQDDDSAAAAALAEQTGERKVGRNDPCPCGSGKKYKQCHGRLS